MLIARLLVVGALAWPTMLGAALWDRAQHPAAPSAWATVVYLAASRVCHQQSERSFHTEGAQWPVCARCAGLYLAAPFGIAGFLLRRRPLRAGMRRLQPSHVFLVAAIPTALTLAWEWGGMGTPPNLVRATSALSLGAVVAWMLLTVTHQVD